MSRGSAPPPSQSGAVVGAAGPVSIPRRDEITETEQAFFAAEASRFGLGVYRELARRPGNLALSPLALAAELSIIQAFARGRVAQQVAVKLGWRGSGERARGNYAALLAGAERGGFTHALAHFAAGEPSATLKSRLQAPLRVEVRTLPAGPERARDEVLGWLGVGSRASNLGSNLPTLRGYSLVGQCSVRRAWLHGFAPERTRPMPFGPGRRETPTMTGTFKLPLARARDLTLVEFPYQDPLLALDLLVPDREDGLGQLERDLTPESLRSWTMQAQIQDIELRLPQFAVSSTLDLGRVLRAMGLGELFAPEAGSAGRTPAEQRLGLWLHHAELRVGEAGSGAVTPGTRAPSERARAATPVDVNRPFLLVMRDVLSGTVLMVVRVVDPSAL